jgi:hypothetical protein
LKRRRSTSIIAASFMLASVAMSRTSFAKWLGSADTQFGFPSRDLSCGSHFSAPTSLIVTVCEAAPLRFTISIFTRPFFSAGSFDFAASHACFLSRTQNG